MTITPIPKPTPRRLEGKREPIDTRGLKHAKKHYPRDSRFMALVRRAVCEIRGKKGHVCFRVDGRVVNEFAHTDLDKGMGIKNSDLDGICLCHSAAVEQTTIGWKRFEAKYGIDRRAIAEANRERYARIARKEETR
jgi:hypothetical protein